MKKFEANFVVLEPRHITVDFDKIYQVLCDENNGVFYDSFSDNIESYLYDIYGIDVNQFDYNIEDITEMNGTICNEIYDAWLDYLEERGGAQ